MIVTVRVNTLLATNEQIENMFHRNAIWYTKLDWYPLAYTVDTKRRLLTEQEEYKRGFFYIQNASSMIPAFVLHPQPETAVLDLCAAPGSKTIQMAGMMNNTGAIVAVDTSRQRLYKLKHNLKHYAVTNAKVVCMDGRSVWRTYPEQFDFVLADVPCSMDLPIAGKKLKRYVQRQKWLLRSAVSCTKPGGKIVYATCTSTDQENEDVVEWILEKEKGVVELVPVVHTYWKSTIPSRIQGCVRIKKDTEYDSFFVTLFKKIRSNLAEERDSKD